LSLLPLYSVKEFKGGPLDHFVWIHNKLLTTKSLKATYDAIARNIRRPYRVTTSLEALQVGAESTPSGPFSKESAKERDRRQADMYMLSIRRRILKGWSDRKRITTSLFDEVKCFADKGPYLDGHTGLMENPAKRCEAGTECGLADRLRNDTSKLGALIEAIKGASRPEDNKRRAALHVLKNTPNRKFEDKDCRGLGDAYYALRCPTNCSVLTSNIRDHAILCRSVGTTVEPYIL